MAKVHRLYQMALPSPPSRQRCHRAAMTAVIGSKMMAIECMPYHCQAARTAISDPIRMAR